MGMLELDWHVVNGGALAGNWCDRCFKEQPAQPTVVTMTPEVINSALRVRYGSCSIDVASDYYVVRTPGGYADFRLVESKLEPTPTVVYGYSTVPEHQHAMRAKAVGRFIEDYHTQPHPSREKRAVAVPLSLVEANRIATNAAYVAECIKRVDPDKPAPLLNWLDFLTGKETAPAAGEYWCDATRRDPTGRISNLELRLALAIDELKREREIRAEAYKRAADAEWRLKKITEAVHNVYYGACWTSDRLDEDAEAKLWTVLRDAAGFKPGESPKPVTLRLQCAYCLVKFKAHRRDVPCPCCLRHDTTIIKEG